MDLFVVSSASDYKVAIVDMSTTDYEISYVYLKDVPYEGRRYSRQVEWAEGTNYVWVGGRQDDEAYVIDIANMELVRTFTEVDSRKLLSVAPYHFMGMADEYGSYYARSSAASSAMSSTNNQDGGSDVLSIVALALSCVAIAAVVASFMAKNNAPSAPAQESASPLTKAKIDDPSLAVPPSVA